MVVYVDGEYLEECPCVLRMRNGLEYMQGRAQRQFCKA